MIRSCLMVAAVLAAGARQSPQTFRASVDAVRVDVLVTDGNRPVGGLKGDDFELRDNGVLQKIDAVAMEDVPLSAMFALDVSASVRDEPLTHLKQAASAAIFALKPSDRAALLTFSEQLRLRHVMQVMKSFAHREVAIARGFTVGETDRFKR